MSRLYVETHFVIGYAKGQDVHFEGLLELGERGIVLSGNTEDFDLPTVKRKLADSGVAYLRTGSAALGWAMNTSFLLEAAS
jgi:hypothetical protein